MKSGARASFTIGAISTGSAQTHSLLYHVGQIQSGLWSEQSDRVNNKHRVHEAQMNIQYVSRIVGLDISHIRLVSGNRTAEVTSQSVLNRFHLERSANRKKIEII